MCLDGGGDHGIALQKKMQAQENFFVQAEQEKKCNFNGSATIFQIKNRGRAIERAVT